MKNEKPKRKALVVFITAGDPDLEETKSILDVIDDSVRSSLLRSASRWSNNSGGVIALS
jgi:hypothetical protein